MNRELILSFLKKQATASRLESLFFVVLLLVLAAPITGSAWFGTEDGAAHSYNAGVLMQLLRGDDAFIGNYCTINWLPSPNWLGHLLLGVFGDWFGVAVAAKVFHLLCVIGLPLAFRRLVFLISPQPRFMSYLVIPFVYNLVFLFGFYNFCLGMVLLLLCMIAWLQLERNPKPIRILLLVLVFTATYFSHQVPWLFVGLFVGIRLLMHLAVSAHRKGFIRLLCFAFIAFLPSLVFMIIYNTYTTEGGSSFYVTIAERLLTFVQMDISVLFKDEERQLNQLIVLVFGVLLVTGLFQTLRHRKTTPLTANFYATLALVSCGFLLLCFAPEGYQGGAVIGLRLRFIVWLFVLLLIAQLNLPTKLAYTAVVVFCMSGLMHMILINASCNELNRDAHAAAGAGRFIRDHSTVAVLPITPSWLQLHIGEYAVAGRDVLLVDNYECDHDYFPVKWKKPFPTDFRIAGLRPEEIPCTWWWKRRKGAPIQQVDYLIITGNIKWTNDTLCSQKLEASLDSMNYEVVYKKRIITLYEYKPQR